MRVFKVAGLAVFVSGCAVAPTGPTVSPSPSGSSSAEGAWLLQSVNGAPFAEAATLFVDADGTIGGRAPCNAFFGAYVGTYPKFSVSDIGSALAYCPQMDAESRYLRALARVTEADRADGRLMLRGPDGVALVFTSETSG